MSLRRFRKIEFWLDDEFGHRCSSSVAMMFAHRINPSNAKWFVQDHYDDTITVYVGTKEEIERVIELMTFGSLI